jgi:hypothetical protein
MFCNRPLGQNQVIETFPIGRRLAFDSLRGRLWVVCRKCERWNLTPIEERWEAVEECERTYEALRTRVSTENVGLGRHAEGLSLVRIGRPLRPEFAAWRYGDQFGRRRKKTMIYGAAGIAVVTGVVVGGLATGVLSGAVLGQSGNFVNLFVNARTLVKTKTPDGKVLKLKNPDLQKAKIISAGPEDEDWVIEIKRSGKQRRWEGAPAAKLASQIIPAINRAGAKQSVVQEAVEEIETLGHPVEVLKRASLVVPGEGNLWTREIGDGSYRPMKEKHIGLIEKLPKPTRLALEMALHEEQERRALEGELWELEAAWREAEEIAEIADNLLLPEGTDEFMEEHREGDVGQRA